LLYFYALLLIIKIYFKQGGGYHNADCYNA
jgi:hypothetical protein